MVEFHTTAPRLTSLTSPLLHKVGDKNNSLDSLVTGRPRQSLQTDLHVTLIVLQETLQFTRPVTQRAKSSSAHNHTM